MSERTYSEIPDAKTIVDKLQERYEEVFWQVRTNQVAVLGIDNKEPTKRSKPMIVRGINNAEKKLLQMNNVPTRYIIETYWSLWNEWDAPKREWMLFNALLRIKVDEGKLIAPDSVEFKLVMDKVGFDWDAEGAVLPPLTVGPLVEFDMELRPGLDDEDKEED